MKAPIRARRLPVLLPGAAPLLLGLVLLGGSAPRSAAQQVQSSHPERLPRVLRVPSEWTTIQSAIDAARPGEVVLVAPGTYVGTIDFKGKAIEVVAPQGPKQTTLNAAGGGPAVLFRSGEGRDSRLIGFTVRGGSGDFEGGGGGISCWGFDSVVATPYLSDCIIERNFTDQTFQGFGGAGIDGDPVLVRCILRDNQTVDNNVGGGIDGAPWMIHCLVERNQGCSGGGVKLHPGAVVQDSVLQDNSAGACGNRNFPLPASGGGLTAADGVVVERSLVIHNQVAEGPDPQDPGYCIYTSAGGAVAAASGATLRHCTILGNRAVDCALVGGIVGTPTLVDCIVRDNEEAPGEYADRTSFRYSNCVGGAGGPGTFDAEPLFVDPGAGDLRLHAGSPCIDAGDPTGPLDPDGTRADVGAIPRARAAGPVASAWDEDEPLVPSLGGPIAFGQAVALSGTTALVGANDLVFVFERSGGAWTEVQTLVAGALGTDHRFGSVLALDGDVAVVGAPREPFQSAGGAVLVYERNPGGSFVQTLRLDAADLDPSYGSAVALEDGTLVIGAFDEFESMGHAFVHHRIARGRWPQVAELRSPYQPTGNFFPEGHFGGALAISGDRIVVGEPFGGDTFLHPGAAFVFQRAGQTPWSWVRVAELVPADPQNFGLFGTDVALDGERALVVSGKGVQAWGDQEPGLPWRRFERPGAPVLSRARVEGDRAVVLQEGHAIELSQPVLGAPWTEVARFDAPPGAMAFEGGRLLVGVPSENSTGVVHVWSRGLQLDEIGLDQAADEETVVLRGRGLDAVTRVLVDGEEQPIVSADAGALVVRPARRDPGLAGLRLETASGALDLAEGFESLPTLRAGPDGPGGTLSVRLRNGASGAFALLLGLDLAPAPQVLTDPPTWYGLWILMTPGRSTRLAVDAFDASGEAELVFPVPHLAALSGLTVHLQAWCRRGVFGPTRSSFTNLVSLGL